VVKAIVWRNGGLLSLFLFVFCPNLNGHGTLLTTDAYTALFTVSTAYFYWRFIKKPNGLNFLYFCISLGLAQIVKYSMIHLIFFFAWFH
jgi:4-amino-4-deoxy-L-arabinose transferase-like glycosyltransferase